MNPCQRTKTRFDATPSILPVPQDVKLIFGSILDSLNVPLAKLLFDNVYV